MAELETPRYLSTVQVFMLKRAAESICIALEGKDPKTITRGEKGVYNLCRQAIAMISLPDAGQLEPDGEMPTELVEQHLLDLYELHLRKAMP